MSVELETIVGLLASMLTAISLLPQLTKLLKDKKTEGISIPMLIILFTGLAAWIYYGILKEDWIIIIANSVSIVMNGTIVGFTLKYRK